MEQYIKKSALVAEIENLLKPVKQRLERDKNDPWDSDIAVYKFGIQLIENIDTLEVKKVDLEDAKKEELAQKYVDYTFKRHNIDPESKEGQLIYYAYMHGMNQCLTQLRTQKGK